eukprot:12341018-Alexandrium_andersonii.AAC.1
MSASLVGSEMCIRDSAGFPTPRPPPPPALLALPAAHGRGVPNTPKDPVSYTHLTLPTICSV